MKRFIGLTFIAALVSVPAFADCSYPRAPTNIPDGNVAALEDMVAAKKSVEQYNKDMNAYQACIKLEHDEAIAKQGSAATEEQKQQMAAKLGQKNDAAYDELATVAARFNEQVRAYKAKHPSK